MNLGVVYKDGRIINHRSFLKIILNPLLRLLGFHIVSYVTANQVSGIGLKQCKQKYPLRDSWAYDDAGCVVEKKRMLW